MGYGWFHPQGTQQIVALAELLLRNVIRLQRMVAFEHGIDFFLQLGTHCCRETV